MDQYTYLGWLPRRARALASERGLPWESFVADGLGRLEAIWTTAGTGPRCLLVSYLEKDPDCVFLSWHRDDGPPSATDIQSLLGPFAPDLVTDRDPPHPATG